MRKVLLTGGSGLLGNAILRVYNERKPNFALLHLSSKDLDLRDDLEVDWFFSHNENIDCVIHCAALSVGLEKNAEFPLDIMYQNIEIDKNVLNNCIEFGISNLLYMGSSSTYPSDLCETELTEDKLYKGSPSEENVGYAYSKIIGTKACEILSKTKKVNYKSLIIPNLYGTNHKCEGTNQHLVTAVISKIKNAIDNNLDEVEIWGDGTNRREPMFVDDLAEYIIWLCKSDYIKNLPPHINVGNNQAYTITEYYQTVANIFGYKGKFVYNLSKPGGVKNRVFNSDLAINNYNWNPHTTLEEGINKIYYDYYHK